MNWVGVTGSWRNSCVALEQDLEREVLRLLDAGDGIITGGALGVDYKTTDLALRKFPDGSRIKVCLPTPLRVYAAYYQRRASEGVISRQQAKDLVTQLRRLDRLGRVSTNSRVHTVNQASYYLRNSQVVAASNELLAFQVNNSAGTQDTIDKAKQRGIPVRVFRYTI